MSCIGPLQLKESTRLPSAETNGGMSQHQHVGAEGIFLARGDLPCFLGLKAMSGRVMLPLKERT